MRTGISIEQSLVLVTSRSLAVIAGFACPGMVDIVAKARELTGRDVYLVVEGLHLGAAGQAAIEGIVEDLQRSHVQRVAPGHCTGDAGRSTFERAYGEDSIPYGEPKLRFGQRSGSERRGV